MPSANGDADNQFSAAGKGPHSLTLHLFMSLLELLFRFVQRLGKPVVGGRSPTFGPRRKKETGSGGGRFFPKKYFDSYRGLTQSVRTAKLDKGTLVQQNEKSYLTALGACRFMLRLWSAGE
jgi:hypothetical protein